MRIIRIKWKPRKMLSNKFLRIAALVTSVGNAAPAAAEVVRYTYPEEGVTRTVDCRQAFYRFADDPQRALWFTCNGYEAIDIPLNPNNRGDPNNRDNICFETDKYDPANPMSINDPGYSQAQNDFSSATLKALVHAASPMHNQSVIYAIKTRFSMGTDVFAIYERVIRAPRQNEQPDGVLKRVVSGKVEEQPYVFQQGWNAQRASKSAYFEVYKMCAPHVK